MTEVPRSGDEVVLVVPQREEIHVIATRRGADGYELELLTSMRVAAAELATSTVFVEFVTASGIHRMQGRIEVPPGADRLGNRMGETVTVRFIPRGSSQLLQRREYVAAAVSVPVVAATLEGNAPPMRLLAVSLSAGGLVIRGLTAPRVGEEFRFELVLHHGDPPIDGRFRVYEVLSAVDVAVQFTGLLQRDRGRIIRHAFEAQRRGHAA